MHENLSYLPDEGEFGQETAEPSIIVSATETLNRYARSPYSMWPETVVDAGQSLYEALPSGRYTTDELSEALQAVHEVNLARSTEPIGWEYLNRVPPAQLTELCRHASALVDAILRQAILVDGTRWQRSEATYKDLVGTVEKVTTARNQNDTMGTWRHGGSVVATTDYVRRIAEHGTFPIAYLEHTMPTLTHHALEGLVTTDWIEGKKGTTLRRIEQRAICDMLGFSADFFEDFETSISDRATVKDKSKQTLAIKDGGATLRQAAIKKLAGHITTLGVDALERVYRVCGLADFDNFSAKTIELMDKLIRGDPETIERLRNQDLHIVIKDTLNDYNGSLDHLEKTLARKNGDVLFFGIRQPSSLYRPFVLLRKYGIKPCTVFLAIHGSPGAMGNHCVDISHYQIPRVLRTAKEISIDDSNVDRIFSEYMQPSSQTGRRELILLSCHQTEGSASEPITTPEAFAWKSTIEDRLVVVGGANPLNVKRVGRNLVFHDDEPKGDGGPIPTRTYYRTAQGIGSRSIRFLTKTY